MRSPSSLQPLISDVEGSIEVPVVQRPADWARPRPVGEREPVKDVARNLDRWTHGIVARVFSQTTIDELAGTTDRRELIRRDVEVHRAIYRAAGNPYLEDILVRQDNLATRIWCV